MQGRKHKNETAHKEQGEEASGEGRIELARARQAQKRQKIRGELRERIKDAARAISQGGVVFEMMLRGDDMAEMQKEVHPDQAERIKEKVLEKVISKVYGAVKSIVGVGETIAGGAEKAFDVIKATVDKKIAQQKKMSRMDVADSIASALADRVLELQEALLAAVDRLPPDKLLAAGRVLDDAEEAGKSADDQDDSPERGNVAEGMRAQAAVQLLGVPAGDLVAAGETAKAAYDAFKESISATGTATEQVDAAQHDMGHPDETQEKLEGAESRMGAKYQKDLARDKTLRARTDQVRS